MSTVQEDSRKFLSMSLEEKRQQYKCGKNYITLDSVPTWSQQAAEGSPTSSGLSDKVSVWQGDITHLEIDAIVNAANQGLKGGGGVDGAIHSAAGSGLLQAECRQIGGCPTGQAVLTCGYKLPAKHIIHTVGPIGEKPDLLEACYKNSLELAKKSTLRSIAFPCVSTGVYGYPHRAAAEIAVSTVKKYLEENSDHFERIIFCVFLEVDLTAYKELMPKYFPVR